MPLPNLFPYRQSADYVNAPPTPPGAKLRDFLTADNWAQCQMAVTRNGLPCSPLSTTAARFCLLGALDRLHWDGRQTRGPAYWSDVEKLNAAVGKLGLCGVSIADYNDTHSWDGISVLLKLADV